MPADTSALLDFWLPANANDGSSHGSMFVAPSAPPPEPAGDASATAVRDLRDAALCEPAPTAPTASMPSPAAAMDVDVAPPAAALARDAAIAADHDGSAPAPAPAAHLARDAPTAGADGQSLLPTSTASSADAQQEVTAPMPSTAVPSLGAPISLPSDMSIPLSMSMPMPMPMPMPLPLPVAMTGPLDPMDPTTLDFPISGDGLSSNGYPGLAPAEQRLSAFARLRFDDGSYYMHTYQIILGRNVHLAHKDMRRLAKVEQLKAKGEQQRAQALLYNRKRKRAGARSVISEAGGIVNAPIEMMPMEYQQRRQSVASQSLSSGSRPLPADSNQDIEHAPQDMLMQAFPEAPDMIDAQVPEDPNDCPLVPIHPQNITDRTGVRGPKGISRQHAKIFYDFDHGNFCLAVLGSNGLHHEGTFLPKGACVELNHGDTILIGMVEMSFYLPDIALTEEQRRQESGSHSRPMSFSFENGRGESDDMDDSASEDLSVNPRHVYHYPVGSDLDSEDDNLAEDEDMDDVDEEEAYSPIPRPKQSIKLKLKSKHHPSKPSKGHKRKVRELSPEERPPKKSKPKPKEAHKELLKEKEREKEKEKERQKDKEREKEKDKEKEKATKAKASKAPTKAPVKSPAKEKPKAVTPPPKEPEQAEAPAPTVKSESPVLLRRPETTPNGEEMESNGLITADVVARYGLSSVLIGTCFPSRKGPGRPPKDGVMSKRQRSQLIKQGKEIEKARAAGIDPADLPQPLVKPKIARRKESNAGEEDDIRETTEKGDGTSAVGDKKVTKPPKPVRTPSPEMRIEDYTEEQLQRPTSNYVVLIHEAISSAPTGQMNLQQIYNYIERNYPWYKFKTTTSGWQSSVRHNLGQHDAFVKGDKEGKGYMWRINPNVSIEKERRKRQVSPPQVNHAQRQAYYPPPNGYPPYGQPGYFPGMPPQGMPPNGAPRPPPVEAVQPRLPPSMARNAAAAPPAAPAPSPYASPWAGGNIAGSPSNPHPPPSYPGNSATPPVSAAAPSGQYGVLYPTSAPPASTPGYTSAGAYTSPFATAGSTPYTVPGRPSPYTPYPPPGPPANSSTPTPAPSFQSQHPVNAQDQRRPSHVESAATPHPSGRYPLSTNPDLIRQLEAFRTVYLQTRIEPGEDLKVDNAIRAYVTPEVAPKLTPQEANLLASIKTIPTLEHLRGSQPIKQEEGTQPTPQTAVQPNGDSKPPEPTATVAAIAADAAANTVPANSPGTVSPNEPQRFTPAMAAMPRQTSDPASTANAPPSWPPNPSLANVQTQRPSVEPLTPVPGSPAVQNGTPAARPTTDAVVLALGDTAAGAEQTPKAKVEEAPLVTNES